MRVMRLAAGLAVGYVLGSRAGRESYEQIVAAVRKVGGHPPVAESNEATENPISTSADPRTSKPAAGTTPDEPTAPAGEAAPAVTAVPRTPKKRTKSTVTAPSVADIQ
jgi:cytoskeletal protein RodZ